MHRFTLKSTHHWVPGILCVVFFVSPALGQPHPIRTSGKISSIYEELSTSDSGTNSSNWLNIATFNASSYIWQPWFALINGSLSLSAIERDSDINRKSETDTVEGSFQFNLFPTSRFPFLLYGSQSRFEQDRQINDRLYTLTTFGMQQSYASRDGRQSYFASYRTQKTDDEALVNNVSIDIFTVSANARFEAHNITGSLNHSSNKEASVKDDTSSALSLRHSYTGRSDLSLENQLSASEVNDEFRQITNDQDSIQFSSFASWTPNNLKDLDITGSFRALDRKDTSINLNRTTPTTANQTLEQLNLNLNQGLTYRWSENLSFQETVNISSNELQDKENVIYLEAVGFNYTSNLINLERAEYNWFAGSSLINQHGDLIDSDVSLNSQLGHNYQWKLFVNPETPIDVSFGQNLTLINSKNGGDSDQIGNSISFLWSDTGVSTRTFVRFSATDSRSFEDDSNRQLFNLQANQNYRLDRSTTITTDLTLQKSRESDPAANTGVTLIAGQIDYTDQRFLNVQGLRYRSMLKASDQEPDIGSINPNTQDANSLSWENEWFYQIGLFESRLSFDYIKSDNDYNTIIIIELTRNFGDI